MIRFLPIALLCALPGLAQSPPPAEDALVMEIVKRIPDFDFKTATPNVQAAFQRWVAAMQGTDGYYDAVERYRLTGEIPNILKSILQQPKAQSAAAAAKALIALGGAAELEKAALALPVAKAPAFLEAIIRSNKREAAELLLGLLPKPDAAPELKSAALAALGKSRNGEKALLAALQANAIPAEFKFLAGSTLHASSDAKTQEAAAAIVPRPKTQGDKPLPPLADLVKLTGHGEPGKAVFGKLCLTCHKVGDTGIDFGPALTEIGSKLAKEALYQSILEPNAGISFGFEGWEIKTQAGDSYLGMIAGETAEDLSVKAPGGVILKVAKASIAEKKALPVSLMTPGLAAAMTQQELVDLVEYLTALRKK